MGDTSALTTLIFNYDKALACRKEPGVRPSHPYVALEHQHPDAVGRGVPSGTTTVLATTGRHQTN